LAFRIFAVIFGVAVAGAIALALATSFFVDWDWFDSLGYVDVFWTAFGAKIALFNVIFAASVIAIWANSLVAHRVARRAAIIHSLTSPWDSQGVRDTHRAGALPKAGIELAQAAAQVGRSGKPEQVTEAVDVLNEARRKLYAILAKD